MSLSFWRYDRGISKRRCSHIMNESNNTLTLFRSGIYLHYKKHLYEADHLTHNASQDNRVEIHYIGLELDAAHEGPRHATRELKNFLFDFVHKDGTLCTHGPTHTLPLCSFNQPIASRFRYLGPVFQTWMINVDPWEL